MKIYDTKCLMIEKYWFIEIRLENLIGIQQIVNISENKVDLQNFQNILDKVKYLAPNLNINSLFLTDHKYFLYHISIQRPTKLVLAVLQSVSLWIIFIIY